MACIAGGVGMHGRGCVHGRGRVWHGGGACTAGEAWHACRGCGHAWQGLCAWQGACVARGGGCMAGEMATAAGSTHPTGMHSCLHLFQHSKMDGDEP